MENWNGEETRAKSVNFNTEKKRFAFAIFATT